VVGIPLLDLEVRGTSKSFVNFWYQKHTLVITG